MGPNVLTKEWVSLAIICSLNNSKNRFQVQIYVTKHTCCITLRKQVSNKRVGGKEVGPQVEGPIERDGAASYDFSILHHIMKLHDATIYMALH